VTATVVPHPRRASLERLRRRRAVAARALPRTPSFLVITGTVAVLNIIGLVMILSASAVQALSTYGSSWYFFNRQLAWACCGAAAFSCAARVDYRQWRRVAPALYTATALLLLVVLHPAIGVEVDGARRWIGAGALRFQPSELAKLALVVACADALARREREMHDWRRAVRPVVIGAAVLAGLVVAEPDLDSTIVLGVVVLAVLAAAGTRPHVLAALAASGAAFAVAAAMAVPYRRARIFAFLDPWSDTTNTGYQISQSLIALGSGGVDGVGLGAGRAKWLFLPNAHTDFIFAIIGEELGLVGTLLVVGLFAGFACAGFQVARHAPDRFGMLLATGITAWVAGQAAINLGAVVGMLPVSGITLPYLSAGGSSLVFTMAAAGVLANIARQGGARPEPRR
jgi:cell division protein FtsW